MLFVNGLPLAVIELKNAGRRERHRSGPRSSQLQTYKREIPALFATNAVLVVSDGVEARIGTLTAGPRVVQALAHDRGRGRWPIRAMPELQVVLEGVFEKRRFLDLVRDFIVFEDDGGGRLVKKMAGYHQFHAVQVAVGETLRAAELRRELARRPSPRAATRPAASRAASPATGASAWSGTPRARARA